MAVGSHVNQLQQAVETLLPAIREAAAEIDDQRTLPEWLIQGLADAGVFRMLLGKEQGGLGLNPVTTAGVIETISRANGSAGWVAMILSVTPFWVAAYLEESAVR